MNKKTYRVVTNIYFSPTGNCQKVGETIGGEIARLMNLPETLIDITTPDNRQNPISCGSDEILVVTVPIYAGRVPNKLEPILRELIKGNDTVAIPVVTYGGRSYGDGLMELKKLLQDKDFCPVAAGAFVSQHAFATKVNEGRPDQGDVYAAIDFAQEIVHLLDATHIDYASLNVDGNDPVGPYYRPLGADGEPAMFLKAKPKTDEALCTRCGLCAEKCPMGSIDKDDPKKVEGICIKCNSCVTKCPFSAKFFDDERFLSHKSMLERDFLGSGEIHQFFCNNEE